MEHYGDNMKQKRWLIAAGVVLVLIFFTQYNKKTAACTSTNCIDFAQQQGTVNMVYGANEDNAWEAFANSATLKQYHRDVNSGMIRIWLSGHWYRTSTFPLSSSGSYTWTQVDKAVDAVVATGAKPMILFAHGDICGSSTPFNFNSCEGFNTAPPSNNAAFGDYVATVTQHLVTRYGQSVVNTWYFELFNEPNGFSSITQFCDTYNIAEARIRAIVPGAKVGATPPDSYSESAAAELISKCSPDFVDIHMYPSNIGGQEGGLAGDLMYNKVTSFKDELGSVEFISGEYNFGIYTDTYSNVKSNNYYGTWLMSALINEIKAGVAYEMTYMATCAAGGSTGCMGMWHETGSTFDNYAKKKTFTSLNPSTAKKYFNTEGSNVDILATESNGVKHVTIVNVQNSASTLSLQMANHQGTLKNINNAGETYAVNDNIISIPLSSYETKFFELTGTSASNPYSDYLTARQSYINGGTFASFISSANTWVGI